MWPTPRAPISSTRKRVVVVGPQHGQRQAELVVERPGRRHGRRRRASSTCASRSLVEVLPDEPVMPTTATPGRRSIAARASTRERRDDVGDDDVRTRHRARRQREHRAARERLRRRSRDRRGRRRRTHANTSPGLDVARVDPHDARGAARAGSPTPTSTPPTHVGDLGEASAGSRGHQLQRSRHAARRGRRTG